MTTTINVHVNGLYVAAITNKATGVTTHIGPNEQKQLAFQHGTLNDFHVEEKYIGDQEWYKEYEAKKSNFLNSGVSLQE